MGEKVITIDNIIISCDRTDKGFYTVIARKLPNNTIEVIDYITNLSEKKEK